MLIQFWKISSIKLLVEHTKWIFKSTLEWVHKCHKIIYLSLKIKTHLIKYHESSQTLKYLDTGNFVMESKTRICWLFGQTLQCNVVNVSWITRQGVVQKWRHRVELCVVSNEYWIHGNYKCDNWEGKLDEVFYGRSLGLV